MNSLEANTHNSSTTHYYLLLKKHIRKGGTSEADISKETFKTKKMFKPHPPLRKSLNKSLPGEHPPVPME